MSNERPATTKSSYISNNFSSLWGHVSEIDMTCEYGSTTWDRARMGGYDHDVSLLNAIARRCDGTRSQRRHAEIPDKWLKKLNVYGVGGANVGYRMGRKRTRWSR